MQLKLTDDAGHRIQLAQAITRDHPEEWSAWLMRALTELSATGTREWRLHTLDASLERLRALKADHPLVLALGAIAATLRDAPAQALPLSARALRLAPFDLRVIAARVAALGIAGDQHEACKLLHRTSQLVYEHPASYGVGFPTPENIDRLCAQLAHAQLAPHVEIPAAE